ncbi:MULTISPECIES: toxin-antitoxin system, toxin component [unclassified Streptomyces]|uniref:toxin-antitoxin system, toxin component n=1 Tax=unclassified Streptomyces TaxID=2593676 RepID=UPI000A858D10|nr:toxin-antitoxin system, toxin component [Streptomyces sp. TSRI0107]
MSTGSRAMRRLSARLVEHLRPPLCGEDVVPAIGEALTLVRGRPVQLRAAAFPPATASGVWVDRTGQDLIVYEENTDPEHQLVIIGHEAWHMFQDHGGDSTGHGPAASRAADSRAARSAEWAAALSEVLGAAAPGTPMDAALHFAARTDDQEVREEVEAERFGFRFATDVRAALAEAHATGDPHTGRIQASMAHRFRRI